MTIYTQARLPQNLELKTAQLVEITETGPKLLSWDGTGRYPSHVVKLNLEQALEMDFQTNIVNNVPNHRKTAWIEALLTKQAMVIHILPFVLMEGIQFPCDIMKKPRVLMNRTDQVEHQKSCVSCTLLASTDFHPLVVKVPTFLIWQAVYLGTLELWQTRDSESPTFNNLVMKNRREKVDMSGKHLIVSGRGRHNLVDCTSISDLSPSVGSTQATLTIYLRIISHITEIKGRAWIGPADFRENAHLLIQALCDETNYKLSKMLEKVALQLSPLLREVPFKFRNQEHPHFAQFRSKYFAQNGFQFEYCDCAESNCPVNNCLDLTGAHLLFILQRAHSLGFPVSLAEVLGTPFVNRFIIRNLVLDFEGYRLKEILGLGPIFFLTAIIHLE